MCLILVQTRVRFVVICVCGFVGREKHEVHAIKFSRHRIRDSPDNIIQVSGGFRGGFGTFVLFCSVQFPIPIRHRRRTKKSHRYLHHEQVDFNPIRHHSSSYHRGLGMSCARLSAAEPLRENSGPRTPIATLLSATFKHKGTGGSFRLLPHISCQFHAAAAATIARIVGHNNSRWLVVLLLLLVRRWYRVMTMSSSSSSFGS